MTVRHLAIGEWMGGSLYACIYTFSSFECTLLQCLHFFQLQRHFGSVSNLQPPPSNLPSLPRCTSREAVTPSARPSLPPWWPSPLPPPFPHPPPPDMDPWGQRVWPALNWVLPSRPFLLENNRYRHTHICTKHIPFFLSLSLSLPPSLPLSLFRYVFTFLMVFFF